jgi:DNA-binding response OmpR family regulator
MNSLNYKTGTLIIDNKKIELTKMETIILSTLSDNKIKTYVEIYNAMYNVNEKEIDESIRRIIHVHKSKLIKKTGLKIKSKHSFGIRLEDKVCLY